MPRVARAVFSGVAHHITQRGNRREDVFYTDEDRQAYLWAAIRYVERNPVRAGMVKKAERYPWSSAGAHCHLRVDGLLSQKPAWQRQLTQILNWSAWLAEGDNPDEISIIRRNIEKGLPCGSDRFIRRLEKLAGRIL